MNWAEETQFKKDSAMYYNAIFWMKFHLSARAAISIIFLPDLPYYLTSLIHNSIQVEYIEILNNNNNNNEAQRYIQIDWKLSKNHLSINYNTDIIPFE